MSLLSKDATREKDLFPCKAALNDFAAVSNDNVRLDPRTVLNWIHCQVLVGGGVTN
jgi:hypothetical protein